MTATEADALADQLMRWEQGHDGANETDHWADRLARALLASDWLAAREAAAAQAVLDDLERRIRHQAKAAAVGSMEWRAHFADLAHLETARARAAAAAGGA